MVEKNGYTAWWCRSNDGVVWRSKEQIGLNSFINLSSSVRLVSIHDPLFRGEWLYASNSLFEVLDNFNIWLFLKLYSYLDSHCLMKLHFKYVILALCCYLSCSYQLNSKVFFSSGFQCSCSLRITLCILLFVTLRHPLALLSYQYDSWFFQV